MSNYINKDWIQKHAKRLQHEFNLNGYISIPNFFDTEELSQIKSNIDRFIVDCVPKMPSEEVYFENPKDLSSLKQLQHLWKHDPYFLEFIAGENKLKTLAKCCLDDDVLHKNLQYFNKPAGLGQPTPPHQDGFFFHIVPCSGITMWIALEDIEPEQGCVNYVQGSHQYGMRHHGFSGVLGFSQQILDMGLEQDKANTMSFPCRAGHLIAHHALTIHWAEGNTSKDRTRKAMGAMYYAASSKEDAEAKAAYQETLNERLRKEGKIS